MKYLTIALFIIINGQLLSQPEISPENKKIIDYQMQKFRYILETSVANHIDSIDINTASEAAYKAFLKNLDFQSDYYSAKQISDLNQLNAGASEGVGIQVILLNDSAVVAELISNSPADSAKIERGDLILFINDQPIAGKKTNEINDLLKGKIGTKVSIILKSYRDNSLKQVSLFRNSVELTSITSSFIIPKTNVGLIASNRFSAKTYDEMITAIKSLKNRGMSSLIIDLRGNPGGYLEQVSKLLDEFLPAGSIISYTKGRNPEYDFRYESSEEGQFKKLPLVVLIDEQSASASEIFAGAMQDLDRGIVVGTNSFGKGTIQKIWTINDGSAFRLTIGQYFTATGRQIDKDIQAKNSKKNVLDESLRLSMGEEAFAQLKKAFDETGGRTQLPIFTSKAGRTIIGGGGIKPDVKTIADTNTLLTKVLRSNGLLLEFSYNYFKNNHTNLRKEYSDIESFIEKFKIDEKIYNEFVKFSFSRNIWNEDMAKTDNAAIHNLLKAYIAHFMWDNLGFTSVKLSEDPVVLKGIEETKNAVLLLK